MSRFAHDYISLFCSCVGVSSGTGWDYASSSAEEPDGHPPWTRQILSTAFRRAAERVSPAVVTVLVRTEEPEYVVAENGEVVPSLRG